MFDFGPLAAQDDLDILKYFHETAQLTRLYKSKDVPNNFIYVARPGGGKTALVKWLDSGNLNRMIIPVRPARTHLVSTDDDLNAEDHKILIQTELLTEIISELLKGKKLTKELEKECRQYISTWWKSIKKLFKNRFQGFAILGFGFTLSPSDRQSYLREIKRTNRLQEGEDLFTKVSQKLSPIIVVDNPESMVARGLTEVSTDNAKRVGAFLSVLNHLHSTGCQVSLFIREHVLQSVVKHYADSTHFEDRIEGIEWTEDDLIDMLGLRVKTRLKRTWEQVFTIPQKALRREVLPFLVNGPRDLLYICNQAGKGGQRISKPMLTKMIITLRNKKWTEMEKQFGTQWPNISLFARTVVKLISNRITAKAIPLVKIREIVKHDFETPDTELHNLRKAHKDSWISTTLWETTPRFEEKLFFVGCLGYMHEGKKMYPWAGRSLEHFLLAKTVFVSPLFSSKLEE